MLSNPSVLCPLDEMLSENLCVIFPEQHKAQGVSLVLRFWWKVYYYGQNRTACPLSRRAQAIRILLRGREFCHRFVTGLVLES